MGIGQIYKQLTFDGEASGDYGLYITGEGTFNAPERDVEMVTIPGRNGSLVLDHGRFENIEVTYPAGVFGVDEEDFADKIGEIRAWLCSKRGYVRLTDEYNPDEFRLAVYKSGLEVSPAKLMAGDFNIVFDCMPQRFLTSGEDAISLENSSTTLVNPTRFESHPLLEVSGQGIIDINMNPMQIISDVVGWTTLLQDHRGYGDQGTSVSWSISPDYALINAGDTVRINGGNINVFILPKNRMRGLTITSFTEGDLFKDAYVKENAIVIRLEDLFTFDFGTAVTDSASVGISYFTMNGPEITQTLALSLSISSAGVITIGVSAPRGANSFALTISKIEGDSSASTLGNPLYLDLEVGEAYKIENGKKISVNSGVSLGSELPVLKPGTNIVTYGPGISSLNIIPRWWTV